MINVFFTYIKESKAMEFYIHGEEENQSCRSLSGEERKKKNSKTNLNYFSYEVKIQDVIT